jgi:hypothetical protein
MLSKDQIKEKLLHNYNEGLFTTKINFMTFLEDLPKTCPMCFNDFYINKDGSGIGEIKCEDRNHKFYFEFFESNEKIIAYQIWFTEPQKRLDQSFRDYYEVKGHGNQTVCLSSDLTVYIREFIIPEKFSKEDIKEFINKLNMLKTFL